MKWYPNGMKRMKRMKTHIFDNQLLLFVFNSFDHMQKRAKIKRLKEQVKREPISTLSESQDLKIASSHLFYHPTMGAIWSSRLYQAIYNQDFVSLSGLLLAIPDDGLRLKIIKGNYRSFEEKNTPLELAIKLSILAKEKQTSSSIVQLLSIYGGEAQMNNHSYRVDS